MHALNIRDDVATRIRAGVPVVEIGSVDGATGQQAGRPVRLLDRKSELVGCGLLDPENDVVRILSWTAVKSFDAAFFRARVRDAVALRRALGLVKPGESYRAIHGDGDGLSGFAADVYGDYAVLYAYSAALVGLGREIARALQEELKLRGVVVKVRPRGGAKPGQVKQETVGEEPPEKLVVQELGVPYEVHLLGGLNVGLFTDMREHRRNMARLVTGKRVLNTFAYTGALSVTAARLGATSVTSVDLASGVNKWAMENFRLSGLNPDEERWRFETSDVMRFMQKEVDRGAQYDVIIMDPPTVSGVSARSWSMRSDYPDLIALAVKLLPVESGGVLWVSANQHKGPGVMKYIEDGMKSAKRLAQVLEVGGLPPDHPTPVAWPEGRYLEVCYLRVPPEQ
ncbi:MAG: class I SAM-dependent rRNA methyltransferase [Myxococcota bacterium]